MASLKESLEAFLVHTDNLRNRFEDDCDEGYRQEYMTLKEKSRQHKQDYPATAGANEINLKKNRYKDILPFDHTRVFLEEIAGQPGSDYINADYIKGPSDTASYIAAQGPLANTVNDFWRMIWKTEIKVIVMVCNTHEAGRLKCAKYWPGEHEEETYGELTVKNESESNTVAYTKLRTLVVKNSHGDVRSISQLHYQAWPDHGIPQLTSLLDLIFKIRELQKDQEPPILVHCSAGCGRTGTVIVIDYAWTMLKLGKLTEELSLFDIILNMRTQRPAIVQTADQYSVVHEAVRRLFKEHLDLIERHCYENVKVNGESKIDKDLEDTEEYATVENFGFVKLDPLYQDEPNMPPQRMKQMYDTVKRFSQKLDNGPQDSQGYKGVMKSKAGTRLFNPTQKIDHKAGSPKSKPRHDKQKIEDSGIRGNTHKKPVPFESALINAATDIRHTNSRQNVAHRQEPLTVIDVKEKSMHKQKNVSEGACMRLSEPSLAQNDGRQSPKQIDAAYASVQLFPSHRDLNVTNSNEYYEPIDAIAADSMDENPYTTPFDAISSLTWTESGPSKTTGNNERVAPLRPKAPPRRKHSRKSGSVNDTEDIDVRQSNGTQLGTKSDRRPGSNSNEVYAGKKLDSKSTLNRTNDIGKKRMPDFTQLNPGTKTLDMIKFKGHDVGFPRRPDGKPTGGRPLDSSK